MLYGYVVKSIYANNLLHSPGPSMRDSKIRQFSKRRIDLECRERWVFSYTDLSLRTGLKQWLYEQYPMMSCYERTAITGPLEESV